MRNDNIGLYVICSDGFSVFEPQYLISYSVELSLQSLDLLLQSRDCTHASVHWVSQPQICFVHQTVGGISSLALRYLHEHLGDVACTEDSVNSGEFLRLVWGEIRGERALFGTSPPQKLARRARRYRVERSGSA